MEDDEIVSEEIFVVLIRGVVGATHIEGKDF